MFFNMSVSQIFLKIKHKQSATGTERKKGNKSIQTLKGTLWRLLIREQSKNLPRTPRVIFCFSSVIPADRLDFKHEQVQNVCCPSSSSSAWHTYNHFLLNTITTCCCQPTSVWAQTSSDASNVALRNSSYLFIIETKHRRHLLSWSHGGGVLPPQSSWARSCWTNTGWASVMWRVKIHVIDNATNVLLL